MKECTNCQHGKWAMQRPIMFPSEGICVTCTSIKDGEVHYPSNWEPQAMTNADRIRAMSDEELAWITVREIKVWNYVEGYYDAEYKCSDGYVTDDYRAAIDHEVAWLKLPVKEADNDG